MNPLHYLFHRHTFILSGSEKSQIWQTIENLLVDNQVEASICSKCVISLHYHENVYYHPISVLVSAVQCRVLLKMV